MYKDFLLAIYQTGEVIKLNNLEMLPGSEIIAFIRCVYDKQTFSRSNQYYSYSLFSEKFERIESNCFVWMGYSCYVADRDQWLPPLPSWTSGEKIRVGILIQKTDSERAKVNFSHNRHDGYAFKKLSEVLTNAEHQGLAVAIRKLKRSL